MFLLPDSVPELSMSDIDLGTEFLGKPLSSPLLINAITGGTEQAEVINASLAAAAAQFGLAMAVGSMTIAFELPYTRPSFTIVRQVNPAGVILANCPASINPDWACEAVEMLDADGLQLHFNVAQELAMPEGDRDFRGILDNVRKIVEICPVPVIAKEVGFGMTRETVQKLYAAGVKVFDNGGCGGTNFIAIEDQRQGKFGHQLDEWGIPTAASLAEIVYQRLPVQVVASGGIRNAMDIAKAMAMGADMVGIAGLFLKVLLQNDPGVLEEYIGELLYQLQALFLMSGACDCAGIREKPLFITGRTAQRLQTRQIDPGFWAQR